jgi:GTP-binding protein HflX
MLKEERVILVTYPEQYTIKEAIALVTTAGYNVVDVVTQKYLKRAKYGLGKGKLQELLEKIKEEEVDKIVFDEALKTTQAYNLAKESQKEIIDREKLILQIFTKHASTSEAKLQIKLAELKYELIRAKMKVRLARRGEQPGFFGLGEYEVDVYKNSIKKQVESVTRKLLEIQNQRGVQRALREKQDISLVSLAGYTSAGKTSLFNLLTNEDLQISEQIFTTLRTTTRKIPNEKNLLISDTVGFIRRIPTYMIEAFKSTLEELKYADAILLMVDASEPIEELRDKFLTSLNILQELGVSITDLIVVLNKQDLVSETKISEIKEQFAKEKAEFVIVSSKTGFGVDTLFEKIHARIGEARGDYFLDNYTIPIISDRLDWLKKSSNVKVTKCEEGLHVEVVGKRIILKQFENYLKRARRNIHT